MRSVIQEIDNQDRILIPEIIMEESGIIKGSDVVITHNDCEIEIIKHESNRICVFCLSNEKLIDFKGKGICKSCKRYVKKENNG